MGKPYLFFLYVNPGWWEKHVCFWTINQNELGYSGMATCGKPIWWLNTSFLHANTPTQSQDLNLGCGMTTAMIIFVRCHGDKKCSTSIVILAFVFPPQIAEPWFIHAINKTKSKRSLKSDLPVSFEHFKPENPNLKLISSDWEARKPSPWHLGLSRVISENAVHF